MQVLAIVVIAVMALSAQAGLIDEQIKKFKGFFDECVSESGVDKELIARARQNDFVEDEKLQNHYLCMMYKLHFMEENGTLHPETMKAELPDTVDPVKGRQIIDKCCVRTEGASNAVNAYNFFKCLVSTVEKDIHSW